MQIFIGSDHAGLALKKHLLATLTQQNEVEDVGVFTEESSDYPDIADAVAHKLQKNNQAFGILICGSGQGMCMRANRYPFIRAALCFNPQQAQLTREHNDANVLCLAGRELAPPIVEQIIQIFLKTAFSEGRHQRRVQKLSQKPLY